MAPEIRIDVDDLQGATASDWSGRLLQSPLFRLLPAANLQAVFDGLKRVELCAGQTLVAEGQHSGYYDIVAEGEASLSRAMPANGRRLSLGLLMPGETFGALPLITGQASTARLRWKSDGAVMRLPAAVFRQAIADAVLRGLTPQAAQGARAAGAVWLDVREPAAYRVAHLEDALNLPLPLLPWLCARLTRERRYLICAETPAMAAAAAFELMAAGHRAQFLAAPWQVMRGQGPGAAVPDALPAELEALIARRVRARETVLRDSLARVWARREAALHAAYARLLAEVSGTTGRAGRHETPRSLLRQADREGPTA